MENKQAVSFGMYEMEYRGGAVESTLPFIPFEEKYYGQYRQLINDCYYDMRKALNIRPYGDYCDTLEEVLKHEQSIFLHVADGEIICTVSCIGNEIESAAVNLKYQRQGYGRKLMEFALEHYQYAQISPIKLVVNKWSKNAIGLYKSLGFEITKEAIVHGISTKGADGNWTFEFTSTEGLNLR